jgi:hypothetical protein
MSVSDQTLPGRWRPTWTQRSLRTARTGTGPALADVLTDAFLAYGGEVGAHLRALLRNGSDAEDLHQEAFLRLHAQAAAGRPPENVRAWLHRVAINLAMSRGRHIQVEARMAPRLRDDDDARPPTTASSDATRPPPPGRWPGWPGTRIMLLAAASWQPRDRPRAQAIAIATRTPMPRPWPTAGAIGRMEQPALGPPERSGCGQDGSDGGRQGLSSPGMGSVPAGGSSGVPASWRDSMRGCAWRSSGADGRARRQRGRRQNRGSSGSAAVSPARSGDRRRVPAHR